MNSTIVYRIDVETGILYAETENGIFELEVGPDVSEEIVQRADSLEIIHVFEPEEPDGIELETDDEAMLVFEESLLSMYKGG